jgi:two-component system, cell cycle response regulator DivK
MPKILIVEDNEENRDSLSRRLQRRGYEVVAASDGKAGVAMAQAEKPDLILMDMNMPHVDGWEATRQIRAITELQDVGVLALTAHALAGDKERALQAGCADYHTKPVDFTKLLAQMEAILQKRSANSPARPETLSSDAVAGDKPQ